MTNREKKLIEELIKKTEAKRRYPEPEYCKIEIPGIDPNTPKYGLTPAKRPL